jgi:hypothetical protein
MDFNVVAYQHARGSRNIFGVPWNSATQEQATLLTSEMALSLSLSRSSNSAGIFGLMHHE